MDSADGAIHFFLNRVSLREDSKTKKTFALYIGLAVNALSLGERI